MGLSMMRKGRAAAVALLLALAAPASVLAQQVVNDDFSDRTSGWTVRVDDGPVRIDYVDGHYEMSATQPVGIILANSGYSFNDGSVSVELQDMPGSAVHAAGIFVRAQDSANFYGVVLGSDGSIGMFHYVNGSYVADGPSDLFLRDGLFKTDAPNLLTVTAAGPSLTYFVNGEQIATINVTRWDGGVAGLVIGAGSTDPVGTMFDNWRIEAQ